MDIDKALLDPGDVFQYPDEVLRHAELTRDQKREILRRWEYDARELEVAEEENLAGGPPSLLREIHQALRELEDETSHEPASPTKQGSG